MPEFLLGLLLGGSGGGLLGFVIRAKLEERSAIRAEGRTYQLTDLKHLRDELLVFLGEIRAHFEWLVGTRDPEGAGGDPSPRDRAKLIRDWVMRNAPRAPREHQGPMWKITHVAYQLALGDRHFLDQHDDGYEQLEDAWNDLTAYAEDLTRRLHYPQD